MKKTNVDIQKIASVMKYQEALDHIAIIFSNTSYQAILNYSCVCGISCSVIDSAIDGYEISYNKICITTEGKVFFWPIQKYSVNVSPEEGKQLLNALKEQNENISSS